MTHRILSLVFTFIILLATAGLGPSTSADDSATQTPAPAGPAQLPLDEAELQTQWTGLDDQQAGQIIRDNLNALVRATHAYYDAKGVLPPAVVPNAAIPAEKRLSGLVLLLPDLRPLAHAHDGKEGLEKTAADPLATMAQTLFKSIDLLLKTVSHHLVIPRSFFHPRFNSVIYDLLYPGLVLELFNYSERLGITFFFVIHAVIKHVLVQNPFFGPLRLTTYVVFAAFH